MKNETVVYQEGSITITKRFALGKERLGGFNKENGATVTAVLNNENEIPNKIKSMVENLKKDTRIDLTSRLQSIEEKTLSLLS